MFFDQEFLSRGQNTALETSWASYDLANIFNMSKHNIVDNPAKVAVCSGNFLTNAICQTLSAHRDTT